MAHGERTVSLENLGPSGIFVGGRKTGKSTLLGERLLACPEADLERQVIGKAPKFYLFDVGVAGILAKRRLVEMRGEQFGT